MDLSCDIYAAHRTLLLSLTQLTCRQGRSQLVQRGPAGKDREAAGILI